MKMTWGFTQKEATLEDLLAQVGPGWASLLTQLVKDLENLGWNGMIMQVKEKFGGLRFYTGTSSDEMDERILKAESTSKLLL